MSFRLPWTLLRPQLVSQRGRRLCGQQHDSTPTTGAQLVLYMYQPGTDGLDMDLPACFEL